MGSGFCKSFLALLPVCLFCPFYMLFKEKMKTEKSKKGINRSRLAEA